MTNLATARWPELGHVDVVLVPLGSTEQHGPHLPFDTDTVIACAVAEAVARRFAEAGLSAYVAPAVPVGSSGEHQDFPGTISIGNDALRHIVIELARSVKNWSPRIVFVNGHGGNVPTLNDALSQLVAEEHEALWVPCGVPGQDAHAGREETSVLLHLAPTSVRLDLAAAGASEDMKTLLPRLQADGVRAVSPNGVLGDPAGASAAEGREILVRMTRSVLDRIGDSWPDFAASIPSSLPDSRQG
jgi:creatinine amidohydrolase